MSLSVMMMLLRILYLKWIGVIEYTQRLLSTTIHLQLCQAVSKALGLVCTLL